jgi:hypothetical protein
MLWILAGVLFAQSAVERYAVFEASFQAAGKAVNPYRELAADAEFVRPDGSRWRVPLFWDGGQAWRVRVSPDALGTWRYEVRSADAGLNNRRGSFDCVESGRAGGIRAAGSHFQRQNGRPFWFLGDTAWGYFIDSEENRHHRPQAEAHARARAAQGFNVIHAMLLSEVGEGNPGGRPFDDIEAETINPKYWQEVDARLRFANQQGLTVGLAIAWGDKQKKEPWAWRRFPDLEARKRYARYVAARYAAFDVYFLVSGEWHAEVRTRGNVTEQRMFDEFVAIGDALRGADPHARMMGIHPMTAQGSVREFASAGWMSFSDYQQNYRDLHGRILLSRHLPGPVVNSEYGYLLRDRDGDGKADKSNSHSVEDMRFASWDIVMAGGYLVTGFGATYLAGHRDPGPFDLDAAKNDEWESQIGHIRTFFEQLDWRNLTPADGLLTCRTPRGAERVAEGRDVRPPESTYWALARPGETYVVYVRGVTDAVELELGARNRTFAAREFDPRTGEWRDLGTHALRGVWTYLPKDTRDWVAVLQAND